MATEGVDFSWARPGAAALKRAGKKFVVRYLFEDGMGGKGLDAGELADYVANGLEVVLVFEQYAQSPLGGRATGRAHAQSAEREIKRLGLPAKSPVYFAVDWDASAAQQGVVDEYLRGAAEVVGLGRVGVYGSYAVMDRCMANKTATWFWQTYAWSGGKVRQGIHLYQYLNGQNINGAVDYCRTSLDNYGQVSKAGQISAPSQGGGSTAKPSTAGTYTVQKNDTLSGIASRFGTTYQELARINNISNPSLIYPGQIIRLSGNASVAPAATSAKTYTVVKNDTLSSIAQRFGTSWQTLAAINGLPDPNKIYPGQVLKLTGGSAAAQAPAAKTYTVKKGDTLSGIASANGTSWQRLQQINGIPDANKIYPGQVIRLT